MADNVPITPGSGELIAADDVGGVKFQKMKLDLGGDGLSLPVIDELPIEVKDIKHFLEILLGLLANPMFQDPTTGRIRVTIDNIAGALTLSTVTTVGTVTNVTTVATVTTVTTVATVTTVSTVSSVTAVGTVTTVTTVGTVTNMANIGGLAASGMIHDAMNTAWAIAVRPRLT